MNSKYFQRSVGRASGRKREAENRNSKVKERDK